MRILRDYHPIELVRLLCFFMEIITILLIRMESVVMVAIWFYFTLFCQIIHSVCVMFVVPMESENSTTPNVVVDEVSAVPIEKMECT